MSLIRPQDYLHSSTGVNLYWSELLRTVDQFDQLMQLEKREIANCIREYYQKRMELVKQFSEFKDSLRFEGEVQKRQIHFVEMTQFGSFFKNYHHNIIDIIEKVVFQPKLIAKLLAEFPDSKRIKFEDFLQNIVFNIYPCYLHQIQFMQAVLDHWPYSVQLLRPTQYTLLDQAISGFMKAPVIVCYVERIVSRFLQEANNCHMSTFAFDEEAIQSEIQTKRQVAATFSLYNQQKSTSWKDKLKTFFKRDKDDSNLMSNSRNSANMNVSYEQSFISNQSDRDSENDLATVNDMMKKRQTNFFELIRKTTDSILQEEVPLLLCKMMACFDHKINQLIGAKGEQTNKIKHYCYFLMTNLILAELHNKFTISHQQSGMSHADLQNISEIIKILNQVFQGLIPESEKYKNQPILLTGYRDKIQAFYNNILVRGKTNSHSGDELFDRLLCHYEKSVVLSFNDISIIVCLLQNVSMKQKALQNIQKTLDFMNNKQLNLLFDASNRNRTVKFKNVSYSCEHIYFMYQCRSPSIKEVIDYYLTVDQPLADIPLIRQILLKESNLKLQQTLEIQQDLKLIQKLPIKQIRGYLGKLAQKFKQLRVKDGRLLQSKFQQSFRATLGRSLRRKEWLLYYRSQLAQRLSSQGNLMEYFTGQLNSAQFYERMAGIFCQKVALKIYLNIQNNLFKVHKSAQDLKKIQISTLIVAKDDSKTSASNQNYILRNSFKLFQGLKQLLRCLSKNQITKTALSKGRHPDQFNQVFQQICQMVVSKIKDFVTQKHIMQVLSQDKLAIIVVRKMQDNIYNRYRSESIAVQKDKQLITSAKKIDKTYFWNKDLSDFGLDRQFLVDQGVDKFTAMMRQNNTTARLKHFAELFKIIFTVLGFTMAKNKISAEIVNPLNALICNITNAYCKSYYIQFAANIKMEINSRRFLSFDTLSIFTHLYSRINAQGLSFEPILILFDLPFKYRRILQFKITLDSGRIYTKDIYLYYLNNIAITMHLFKVAFYASGAYYALFVDQGLLIPFFTVVAIYLIISHFFIGGKPISTRKKMMVATWADPSEGNINVRVPIKADRLLKLLETLPKQNRPTITHFVIKAVGALLSTQPDLNGKLVFGKYVQYDSVDVSCLVDIQGGKDLTMISIRGVDKMSVKEIGSFIRSKTSTIKKSTGGGEEHIKKVKPFSFVPSFLVSVLIEVVTFITSKLGIGVKAMNLEKHSFGAACVTSLGMLGFEDATAPFTGFTNCTILASANAVHEAPIINNGKIEIGHIMNINFVVDHRYVDGGKCTKLVPALKKVMQEPELFLNSAGPVNI